MHLYTHIFLCLPRRDKSVCEAVRSVCKLVGNSVVPRSDIHRGSEHSAENENENIIQTIKLEKKKFQTIRPVPESYLAIIALFWGSGPRRTMSCKMQEIFCLSVSTPPRP